MIIFLNVKLLIIIFLDKNGGMMLKAVDHEMDLYNDWPLYMYRKMDDRFLCLCIWFWLYFVTWPWSVSKMYQNVSKRIKMNPKCIKMDPKCIKINSDLSISIKMDRFSSIIAPFRPLVQTTRLHSTQLICKCHWSNKWSNQGSNIKELKVDDTPNGRSPRKRLIFAALCNDLIDYFIVCFEHQCNTMRAV